MKSVLSARRSEAGARHQRRRTTPNIRTDPESHLVTHAATAVHALRLPLLVATTLALALTLAVGIASPAAGLVDDSVAQ